MEPGSSIERIGSTASLVITMDADTLTPTDEMLAAEGCAREPKQLRIVPGGHYDIYGTPPMTARGAAREWFLQPFHPPSYGRVSQPLHLLKRNLIPVLPLLGLPPTLRQNPKMYVKETRGNSTSYKNSSAG
jgi:hypothetical protein